MLKIYVTNLKKYSEGALVGEWVDLPHEDIESVINKISNDGADELFITDYESELEGLEVGEYDNIETLDSIMQEVDNLTDSELLAFQAYLLNGSSLDEALEEVHQGNYTIYYDCNDMSDVVYQVVNDCGLLDGVPEEVKMYFDYEAYGRDMDINRTFIQIDNSFVELY
jgi:antirestriction protein